MSSRRRNKQPVRTKLCGRCGGTLDWDAKGCIHCGAGELEDPVDERPWAVRFFSVPGITLSAVAALVLVGAFYFLTRDTGQSQVDTKDLRRRLAAVNEKVEALTLRHTAAQESASHEIWRARSLIKAGDADGHEAAQAKADKLMADATRIKADLDAALGERSEITKELEALGQSP